MSSGVHQRRFIQRFLAVIAAFVFLCSDLLFPVVVEAFVPSPAFLPVVEPLVVSASTGAAASLAAPVVVGAIVIGAAYYLWRSQQTDAARLKAADKYCTTFKNDSVCAATYQIYGINYSNCQESNFGNFHAPYGYVFWTQTSASKYCGASRQLVFALDASGNYNPNGYSPYDAFPFTRAVPVDSKSWQDWPASKRKAAFDLLAPNDISQILETGTAGDLAARQSLPDGAYISSPDGAISFVPGPLTVPEEDINLDTDGDGIPDEEERRIGTNPNNPDTDGDGLSDGEERRFGTDLLNPDTDGDGIPDGQDPDANADGVPDALEDALKTEGEVPETSSPSEFSKPNFVQYAFDVFSNKFPLDIIGSLPAGQGLNDCPTVTFWGEGFEVCIVRDFLKMLKIPVVIAFTIWALLTL